MPGPSPYALAPLVFPFRALALQSGRAPLGGPRETVLATLVAARLAAATLSPRPLDRETRARRAEAARQWMASVALPATVRAALLRLIACTAEDDALATQSALSKVTDVTANSLDRGSRSELDRLHAWLAA